MSDAAIKANRRVLRQVQSHLVQMSINAGAVHETVGLVDAFVHPESELAHLNFITPRKNTAWVSAKDIEKGLDYMRAQERVPRIEYIEGLYPPVFAKSLHGMGLVAEREVALMAFSSQDHYFQSAKMLDGVTLEMVEDQQGSAIWWYVWRNAHYDVITGTADPVFIGQDMYQIASGHQIDIVMYRYRFPIGVARINTSLDNKSAEIVALSIMRQARTQEIVQLLQNYAMKASLECGCNLVFTSGETENDRRLCRDNGFVDFGSVVYYAENRRQSTEEDHVDESVEESVFTLR